VAISASYVCRTLSKQPVIANPAKQGVGISPKNLTSEYFSLYLSLRALRSEEWQSPSLLFE
jgi:hypothetical protein